jgi:mercuric ion binding protein
MTALLRGRRRSFRDGGCALTFAAERTITLAVQNMYRADRPFIVAKSLQAVPGVSNVMVSFKTKTATVTHDDGKADVSGLTAATTNAGYPSAPKG